MRDRGKDREGEREKGRKRKNVRERYQAFLADEKARLYKSRPLFIKQKTIDHLKSIFAYLSRGNTNSEYLLNYAEA